LEVPQKEAVEIGREVSRIMVETAEEYVEGYVKFTADIEIGPNWGELVPVEV
jgi:DNA polymerase I-like protein with 3'-5' exonuclease and polymerase domains